MAKMGEKKSILHCNFAKKSIFEGEMGYFWKYSWKYPQKLRRKLKSQDKNSRFRHSQICGLPNTRPKKPGLGGKKCRSYQGEGELKIDKESKFLHWASESTHYTCYCRWQFPVEIFNSDLTFRVKWSVL